jgi:hypothetical protein
VLQPHSLASACGNCGLCAMAPVLGRSGNVDAMGNRKVLLRASRGRGDAKTELSVKRGNR